PCSSISFFISSKLTAPESNSTSTVLLSKCTLTDLTPFKFPTLLSIELTQCPQDIPCTFNVICSIIYNLPISNSIPYYYTPVSYFKKYDFTKVQIVPSYEHDHIPPVRD